MHPAGSGLSDPFASLPIDWTYKGIPEELIGRPAGEIAALGLSLFDSGILFPIATLNEHILRANSRWMMRFLDQFGVALAPHGKTTMSPELMRLQLSDGAWALTAATTHHVRAYRRWGARRIFMANQLVGAAEIGWVAAELAADSSFEFYCLVDSLEATAHLAERLAVERPGRPVNVLVEVGIPGGRAGVRSLEEGLQVAAAVAERPQLALCGVETFEGLFLTAPDSEARARWMLDMVVELTRRCEDSGYFRSETVLLSGGGSSLFDVAAQILSQPGFSKRTQVVIRSGCYLVHDHGMYRDLFQQLRQRTATAADPCEEGLRSALQVWARVQSKPEPGRMICGLGKRDIGSDIDLPTPLGWVPQGTGTVLPVPASCVATGLNDQHLYLEGDVQSFRVGDLVAFGASHPCTTLDKWRALLTVDHRFRITGLIRTYF